MGIVTSVRPVYLVDDHPLILDALRLLIEADGGFAVVGTADTGRRAVEGIMALAPDIVVLDLLLPDIPAEEVIRSVASRLPNIVWVILTASRSIPSLKAITGAKIMGYLNKASAPADLLLALKMIVEGEVFTDPILTFLPDDAETVAGGAGLTNREASVLHLVARGFGNKQIAENLGIGPKTVETHKGRALAKLGLNSRADIFQYARLRGWLEDN